MVQFVKLEFVYIAMLILAYMQCFLRMNLFNSHIYVLMFQYALGKDPHEFLLEPLKQRMAAFNHTNCGEKTNIIIKRLEQSIIDAFGPSKTSKLTFN